MGNWQEAVWDCVPQSLWRVNELGNGCSWAPGEWRIQRILLQVGLQSFYELYKWRVTDLLSIMV